MTTRMELYGVRCYIGAGRPCSWPWVWADVYPTSYTEADRIAGVLNSNLFKSPATAYDVAPADPQHPLWDFAFNADEDGGIDR